MSNKKWAMTFMDRAENEMLTIVVAAAHRPTPDEMFREYLGESEPVDRVTSAMGRRDRRYALGVAKGLNDDVNLEVREVDASIAADTYNEDDELYDAITVMPEPIDREEEDEKTREARSGWYPARELHCPNVNETMQRVDFRYHRDPDLDVIRYLAFVPFEDHFLAEVQHQEQALVVAKLFDFVEELADLGDFARWAPCLEALDRIVREHGSLSGHFTSGLDFQWIEDLQSVEDLRSVEELKAAYRIAGDIANELDGALELSATRLPMGRRINRDRARAQLFVALVSALYREISLRPPLEPIPEGDLGLRRLR